MSKLYPHEVDTYDTHLFKTYLQTHSSAVPLKNIKLLYY